MLERHQPYVPFMFTILLVLAVAIGVFVFVKNNPKKTKTIDAAVRETARSLEKETRERLAKWGK